MKAIGYITLSLLLIGLCITGCSKDSGQTAKAMNAEAMKLAQSGQKSQALEKAKAALKKSEENNGTDYADRVMSLEIMGLMYQATGDPGNAEIAFLQALSVVRKYAGPNSMEEAKITNNLAGLYYVQSQFNLAASFFKQSLAIGEKAFPAGDPRLDVMRKNIKVCEEKQSKGAVAQAGDKSDLLAEDSNKTTQAERKSGPDIEDLAETDPLKKIKTANSVQDLVPQQVKDSMISQLARQNIFISDLEPKPPVLIDDKGMVFPYHAIRKQKGTDATQEIVVLFAAIKNPEKPKALVFQQCRLISNTSYLSALEKGGVAQLKRELQDVFPSLYL